MNTKKIKQLWNCFLRKIWGLPDFLITGSGVETWVRILEEERDLGSGCRDRRREGTSFKVVDCTDCIPQSWFSWTKFIGITEVIKPSQTPK